MSTKAIAIDLDDTLNDFSETLRTCEFVPDGTYSISEEVLAGYMKKLRAGTTDESDLLSTEYSFFRYKVHQQCYQQAKPRADGVEFMRWLRRNDWRIIICTYRDLRRANACTRQWLADHEIPFDHLFMAWNKIVFCRLWGIGHLVDDDLFNITHGETHGVKVYFPFMEKHRAHPANGARGFGSFEEVRQWIQE
jgi:5'(3')-deoxyribonucleotidase